MASVDWIARNWEEFILGANCTVPGSTIVVLCDGQRIVLELKLKRPLIIQCEEAHGAFHSYSDDLPGVYGVGGTKEEAATSFLQAANLAEQESK